MVLIWFVQKGQGLNTMERKQEELIWKTLLADAKIDDGVGGVNIPHPHSIHLWTQGSH